MQKCCYEKTADLLVYITLLGAMIGCGKQSNGKNSGASQPKDHRQSSGQITRASPDKAKAAGQEAATTVTLADGTKVTLQQWGKTYETLEYQPPIDVKKAKVIAEYDFGTNQCPVSIALDQLHKKVYWA